MTPPLAIALALALSLLILPTTHAAEPRPSTPPSTRPVVPPPPPPPEDYQPPRRATDGDVLEPEVTIQSRGTEIHEEYRYNGQLYMVKITPARGPAYYLIYDERGNTRRSDLEPEVTVPTWIIKRF